jgi:hypothetical protein
MKSMPAQPGVLAGGIFHRAPTQKCTYLIPSGIISYDGESKQMDSNISMSHIILAMDIYNTGGYYSY